MCHSQRENIYKGESLEIVAEHEAHAEEGITLGVGEHVLSPLFVLACIERVPEVILANCHLAVGQCLVMMLAVETTTGIDQITGIDVNKVLFIGKIEQ